MILGDSGPLASARVSLFLGKGGVGKSTLAAATAVGDARAGARVLLVTLDQAHSLGDILDVPVPPTGELTYTPLIADDSDQGGRLDGLTLDTLALLAARWPAVADTLAVAPQELSALPGVQELLGWHEVGQLAAAGQWDRIIVDCASTAEMMRVLTLPATFQMYLEHAWPRHRRLASASDDPRLAAMVDLVERIATAVAQVHELLIDGARAGAHLVLTAERVVAADAIRTVGALSLMGVRLQEVIVNRLSAPEPTCDQQAVLDGLAARVGDAALMLAPQVAAEPIGITALGHLLDTIGRRDGSAPPAPMRPEVDRESGVGLHAVYRLRLELPHVDPGELTLGRVDDDLIVGVCGMRRRVRLASVLRRCVVTDAQLCGSELTVRFRPNPEVWPV